MGKWASAAFYILAMAGIWFCREDLLHRIESLQSSRDAAAAAQMFVLAALASLFPVIPFGVVAALVSVPFVSFVLATAAGKLPVMLVFAFIGEQLVEDGLKIPAVLLLYAALAGGLYAVYRYRAGRRRREQAERC
ncbi:hypothetical protein ABD76_06990 [Paenibacillus dendritiformis]|uniref:hypothetical protein n=1 Tax=Paenibacillus dendritiformis TaxID=130049 RepID=UPI0018CD5447|nr:hypothetical protein [Paenibacillus dendritiformis]MBG9792255.1 hypothetical protein [Paenibacillus dendritiformis]